MQSLIDARGYLLERYQSPEKRGSHLKFFYRFFRKYYVNWEPSKADLLELGAGPSLQVVLTGSAFFSNIVVSEFENDFVKELKLWINSSPNAFDWKPTVKYLLKNCEGMTENEANANAVARREEVVRQKISAIVHCDATQENVGLDPAVIPDDVITAYASLAAAVRNQEGFVQALKNARGVLKKGGYLCTLIAGKCSTYRITPDSDELIPTYYITEEHTREGFKAAGFHLEELEVVDPVTGVADVEELYLCVARK